MIINHRIGLCALMTGILAVTLAGHGATAPRKAAPIIFAKPTPADKARQNEPRTDDAKSASKQNESAPKQNDESNDEARTRRIVFRYPQGQAATDAQNGQHDNIQPSGPNLLAGPQEDGLPIRITATQTAATMVTDNRLSPDSTSGNPVFEQQGPVNVYDDSFNNQPTANGETFNAQAMSAAHPHLPLPSLAHVINDATGREIVVRINDRGPFDGRHILTLSPRAASLIGVASGQATTIRIRYLGPAPVNFSGERQNPDGATPVSEATAPPITTPAINGTAQAASMQAQSGKEGETYIQLGTFTKYDNAERLAKTLTGRLPVLTETVYIEGKPYFRVMAGPLANRSQAESYQQELARSGTTGTLIITR